MKQAISRLSPRARGWLLLSLRLCVLWGFLTLGRAAVYARCPSLALFDELVEMCKALLLSVGISFVFALLIHREEEEWG